MSIKHYLDENIIDKNLMEKSYQNNQVKVFTMLIG